MFNPSGPCTCFDVFHASIGRVDIRQSPAIADPNDVWIKIGSFFKKSEDFETSDAYILAAVSPNLDIGPIIKAGTSPR